MCFCMVLLGHMGWWLLLPSNHKKQPSLWQYSWDKDVCFPCFFFFVFFVFSFVSGFSCFFHGFSVVLPQVFSHIRPGPSKSPSWPSWVLNESWTSEWGEGEVDDTICDLDLPRPGGGTVPIEWCVFTPWFWSFYHVLPSFTVFYFVLPVFGGSRWMMTNHQIWGYRCFPQTNLYVRRQRVLVENPIPVACMEKHHQDIIHLC